MGKILVSACLLGDNCKYNGGNNYSAKVAAFTAGKEVIRICPELLSGLGVPRPRAEIRDGIVYNEKGENVHRFFELGVERAMERIAGEEIDCAVLQSRSPSCGVRQVYDGRFSGTLKDGMGLFAQRLKDSGIRVIDVADLD